MDNDAIYQGARYQIKLDPEYGYYHLFPVPTQEELDAYYQKQFFSQPYSKQINDSSKAVQEEEKEFIEMQYQDMLEVIKKRAPGNKIVDIGCGYGNFLKFFQDRSFQVLGVDPADDAVADCQAAGLNVVKANIEDCYQTITEKQDAAVMINVFEHVREPAAVLKSIRDHILSDNGLLIVRVPNEFNKLQTIANVEYNLKEWWVAAPQHINYFTFDHLSSLINSCGYEILLKEANFPMEMFILFGEQYVGRPELGKAVHQKRVLFEKTLAKHDNDFKRRLYRTLADLGIGREITIYARKAAN